MALRVDTTDQFVDILGFLIAKETKFKSMNETYQPFISPTESFRIGRISSSYTSGRPTIVFEGETVDSLKQYPHMASYTPVADDWVLLAKVGKTHVILGELV